MIKIINCGSTPTKLPVPTPESKKLLSAPNNLKLITNNVNKKYLFSTYISIFK